MGHIHELIDYVVAAYIVHKDKVLLINHKQFNQWMPIGGHIELNEDTEEGLLREIEEECGLTPNDLEFVDNRPKTKYDNKFLLTPQYVDIHRVNEKHRHLCLNHFIRSRTDEIRFNEEEHNAIRWFEQKELDEHDMPNNVLFLAKEAIKTLGRN